jgi:hypothetical protein
MSPRSSPGASDELVADLFSAARAQLVPAASRERVAHRLGIAVLGPSNGAPLPERVVQLRESAQRPFGARLGLEVGWLGLVSALFVGAPGHVPAEPAAPELLVQSLEWVSDGTVPASPGALQVPARADEQTARRESSPGARGSASAKAGYTRAPARASAAHASPGGASMRAVQHSPSSTLLDEVRQLDRARELLGRGDGAGAIAALDRYERTFPKGELGLEARVLRVSGEFAAGRADSARALARELLATAGTERYRSELRRWMAVQQLP